MGNCQAAEVAAAVVQHQDGKVERLYWPTVAAEVMRSNPGHYVALATTLCHSSPDHNVVRVTKLRLLRPNDPLLLGHVYRLVTSQEVVKALRARKQERARKEGDPTHRKNMSGSVLEHEHVFVDNRHGDSIQEVSRAERHKQKTAQASARSRHWRPSLQSISEGAS